MARTRVYRVRALAYYMVMEHSTIVTEIGDVDMRSFYRHNRETGFPCLLGYNNKKGIQWLIIIFINILHTA